MIGSQIRQRDGMMAVRAQCLSELLSGFLFSLLFQIKLSQVDIGQIEKRIVLDRFLVLCLGLVHLALPSIDERQIV